MKKSFWKNGVGYLKMNWAKTLVIVVVVGAVGLALLERSNIQVSLNTSLGGSQDATALTTKLLQNVKRYQKAQGNDKAAALNDMTQTAKLRQAVLLEKAINRPSDVFPNSLPAALYTKMPSEILAFLERETTVEGTAEVEIMESKDFKSSSTEYYVKDQSGKRTQLFISNPPAKLRTGDKVKAKGLLVNDKLVMDLSNSGTGSSLQTTQTAALVSGNRTVLGILFNFQDMNYQPFSRQDAENVLFNGDTSLNNYFSETSYGNVRFSGSVTGWYTIPMNAPVSGTDCNNNYRNYSNAAASAAQQAGINVSSYNHVMYIFPDTACTWAGRGTVGGGTIWISSHNNSYVYNHEMGHNLGMHHAGNSVCAPDNAAITHDCYGDPYDIMGISYIHRHVNGAHKAQMGWGQTTSVSASGTYIITPLSNLGGNKILRIPKPDTNEYYFIEYRQPTGYDSTIPGGATAGVGLTVHGIMAETKRIDLSPGDGTLEYPTLSDGEVFNDPSNSITITQLSHDASGATVQISLPGSPVCSRAVPTLSISPVTQTGSSGQTLSYTVGIRNNDNSVCGNTTFSFNRTLSSGFNSSFTSSSLTVAPGSTANTQIRVTSSSSSADGSYPFTVTAQSNQHTAVAVNGSYVVFNETPTPPPPAPTPTPTTTVPTVVITSPTANSTVTGRRVQISSSASSSSTISKIEIVVDGNLVRSCNVRALTGTCSQNWDISKVSSGTHTITAKAYDSKDASKVGQTSITVTK